MANLEYIGALWKPRSDNPRAPLASGNIKFMGREIRITVWDNQSRKRPDKRDPDFKITLDEPREESKPPGNTKPAPDHGEGGPATGDFIDDIPF